MTAIDFTQVITDPYGSPTLDPNMQAVTQAVKAHRVDGLSAEDAIKRVEDALGEPLTLGRAAVRSLSEGLFAEGDKDSGEKKFERFRIASEIAESETTGEAIVLDAKKITLVKERIGKLYLNAAVVGRCWDLIEPQPMEAAGK